jgi:hypothetical protein
MTFHAKLALRSWKHFRTLGWVATSRRYRFSGHENRARRLLFLVRFLVRVGRPGQGLSGRTHVGQAGSWTMGV